ncbi:hypothetical protein LXA43DRAFT_1057423 [Ganoderma leucocontextum]|nr:hypothetical protein LXA43DRAFT_1057423 [Ganoderma leucocontextum]
MEKDSALSTVVQLHLEHLEQQYELSSMQVVESGQHAPTPPTFSTSSSQAPLQAANSGGPNVQDLTPVDRGVRAWVFCISSFVLEMMMWGFCFRTLARLYADRDVVRSRTVLPVDLLFELRNTGLAWVWQLIMRQGVVFGISGGLLYVPHHPTPAQMVLRVEGICGGVGGFVFPFALTALLDRVGFRWTLRIWAITYVDDLLWGQPSPSRLEVHRRPKALASAATQLYFHGRGGQSRGRVHEQEDAACLVNLKLIFGLRERSFVQGPRLCGDDDQSVSVLWPLSYGTNLVRDWK